MKHLFAKLDPLDITRKCAACGLREGFATTSCPGTMLTKRLAQAAEIGAVDHVDGEWVPIKVTPADVESLIRSTGVL